MRYYSVSLMITCGARRAYARGYWAAPVEGEPIGILPVLADHILLAAQRYVDRVAGPDSGALVFVETRIMKLAPEHERDIRVFWARSDPDSADRFVKAPPSWDSPVEGLWHVL